MRREGEGVWRIVLDNGRPPRDRHETGEEQP
jgi:hypothetical protein